MHMSHVDGTNLIRPNHAGWPLTAYTHAAYGCGTLSSERHSYLQKFTLCVSVHLHASVCAFSYPSSSTPLHETDQDLHVILQLHSHADG